MTTQTGYNLFELEIHEMDLEEKIKKMERSFHHDAVISKRGEEFCPLDLHLLDEIKREKQELDELKTEMKKHFSY